MAVTGNRAWSASSLSPFAVSYVQSGYRLRSPFGPMTDRELTQACVRDLREVIETTTAGDVACLIAEPIQGVGGFVVPPDGFFGAMKEVLDEYGILFVSDEVQTGWGRTGDHFWGFQAHGVLPDLATFAKGLGNGLAIGGVVGRGDLVDSVGANSISTFGGNPLAASGALANLDYLLRHDLQGNALKVGSFLLHELGTRCAALGVVAEVRGRGLMVGVELVEPGTMAPNRPAARQVLELCRQQGLLIGTGGLHGNVLRIAPAMSVTMEEAVEAVGTLVHALQTADRASALEGSTMNHITHWIDGKPWVGDAERRGKVFDPATGRQTGAVDFAAATEVDEAVAAARRAFAGMAVHLLGHTHRRPLRLSGACSPPMSTTWPPW